MVKIDESSCFCKSTATSVFLLTYYGIFLCLLVLFYIIVDIGEEVNHFFGKSGEKRRIIANKLGICGENTEKSSAFVRQNQWQKGTREVPLLHEFTQYPEILLPAAAQEHQETESIA